jgi:hypothetical protein
VQIALVNRSDSGGRSKPKFYQRVSPVTINSCPRASVSLEPPRPTLRPAPTLPDGIRLTRIRDNGTVAVRQISFHVSRTLTRTLVYLVED